MSITPKPTGVVSIIPGSSLAPLGNTLSIISDYSGHWALLAWPLLDWPGVWVYGICIDNELGTNRRTVAGMRVNLDCTRRAVAISLPAHTAEDFGI